MEASHKNFRKRNAILSYLQCTDAHPSAETIFSDLKAQIPDLSIGTVYRNLKLFQQQGLVSVIATVSGVERFDANSYFYITRSTDYFDLTASTDGDLAKAFEKTKAAFLVVSFSSDWLFPTSQSKRIVDALLKNGNEVSFCEIKSGYGHDAFLLEVNTLGRMVRDFLHYQQEAYTNE